MFSAVLWELVCGITWSPQQLTLQAASTRSGQSYSHTKGQAGVALAKELVRECVCGELGRPFSTPMDSVDALCSSLCLKNKTKKAKLVRLENILLLHGGINKIAQSAGGAHFKMEEEKGRMMLGLLAIECCGFDISGKRRGRGSL